MNLPGDRLVITMARICVATILWLFRKTAFFGSELSAIETTVKRRRFPKQGLVALSDFMLNLKI